MHRILEQVCAIAERERTEWLPEVTPRQLEQDGAVFYMNSQNGTEFDWYVNDRLPSFMVFYNDEANLGAVKLHLNRNGTVSVYLYGEQGARLQKQETLPAEYTPRSEPRPRRRKNSHPDTLHRKSRVDPAHPSVPGSRHIYMGHRCAA